MTTLRELPSALEGNVSVRRRVGARQQHERKQHERKRLTRAKGPSIYRELAPVRSQRRIRPRWLPVCRSRLRSAYITPLRKGRTSLPNRPSSPSSKAFAGRTSISRFRILPRFMWADPVASPSRQTANMEQPVYPSRNGLNFIENTHLLARRIPNRRRAESQSDLTGCGNEPRRQSLRSCHEGALGW